MEKAWLKAKLESGSSIESIAREVGRAPSTVAYWVAKHGLASTHAARHAARGGIGREPLVEMLARGLSVRAMAAELGVSYATVRYWLSRHDLATPRGRRLAETAPARAAGANSAWARCPIHGETAFVRRGREGVRFRCRQCRAEAVTARRRRVKAILVQEAGGRCAICGYGRYPGALQFHHVDPQAKSFALAEGGMARALEKARAEVAKCVLLCANCHAEVGAGIATIPAAGPADNLA